MDELPSHAKAVLRRAHQHDECHDEDARRRVREGVARAVGGSAAGAAVFARARVAAQPAAPITKGGPLLGVLGKLAVTATVVALVGSGIALRWPGVQAPERRDTRASAVASEPPVSESAPRSGSPSALAATAAEHRPSAQDERAGDAHAAAPQHAGRRSRGALVAARAPAPDTLDAEVRLLRRLEEAVTRRDTHEADRLLAQHRARFPQPVLLEERQGFSALVGCMEQRSGALGASRAFVTRYPNSVLTARVLRACETEAP